MPKPLKIVRRFAPLLVVLALVPNPARSAAGDPLRSKQWGLTRIKAPAAWNVSRGAGVLVAVVDTGVDFGHPDLSANLEGAPGGDFVDSGDSCSGKKTASSCNGDGPQDANGHGTHVAGIVAAIANNGKGIAGVAPQAHVLPVRVLDADGAGDVTDVADGIRYAARTGADVINLSLEVESNLLGDLLGGDVSEVKDAIDFAISRGVVVVSAAGNSSTAICSEISDNPKTICVGSVTPADSLSSFSNSDGDQTRMYVVAPGGDDTCDGNIWSTVWRSTPVSCGSKRGYDSYAGTSMAAPHVSGVAALLVAKGLNADQIIDCFKKTSEDLGAPGRDSTYGFGLVMASKAVKNC